MSLATKKVADKKESLCEKSMKLVVNIVMLSSLSVASMSLRPTGRSRAAARGRVSETRTLDSMIISSASQASGNGIPREPEMGDSSNTIRHVDDIDARASGFIKRVREKNQEYDPNKQFSNILLPPPPPFVVNKL